MSHIYRYVLCLLLLVAGITNVNAQQYPVTASTQIIPPYSVYLPDYAVPGSDKLRVILVQNDLTVPSYNVRLQMTVEQNGTVIMRTAAMFNPKPLSLSPGIPTIIGGIDLADYLNPANIDYSGGFSRNEYEKTRSLPEGAYRISFTAYDYSRPQVQVSNIGSNVFFFRKSDPPLLNLPICNSRVEKLDPQFLTFNWSSRNSPNPLPGSGTEYVFSLYEVRPAGSNPDYIVRSVRPIYTLVTETNTIVYGPGEPQLRDSMQYVWVVQARDKSGRDMFSNQGLSQSCTFTYLGKNPFTQNNIPKPVLKGRATGERSMRLSWPLAAANYGVEAYRLQYRAAKVGDTEFDWQTEEKQNDTAFTVNSLEPNREYEGRLQWKIAGVYGPFSDVVTIKTDSAKTFVCGDAGLLAALDNKQPLASLSVGKIIRVGNFDIILTEVSGGNGKFTGKGRVITLGFGIGLQMEFKDITVNTDMKVIDGAVYAVTEGIDKFVSDKLDEQHGGNDVGGVQTGDIVPDITTKLKIFTPANIKVNTDAGTITLTDSNTGQQEVIDYKDKGKTLPLVLEDADGNLYNIDKGGKVTSIGKRDSSITSTVLESLKTLSLDKGTVTFTPGTGNVYGFDAWKSSYAGKTAVEKEYESLASGKYHVSSKAIVPDEQEQVIATLTNAASGITASKLKFITGKGIVLTAKDSGNNTFAINLTGGPGGDAQEIYAAHPDGNGGYVSLGKLLLVSYKPLQKTLVLVPIGAQTTVPSEQIKTALEKTYKKLGITYTVQVDESFRYNKTWDANGDSILQDKGSAFLSNDFKGEEKALKKAYKKAKDIDDNSVYLFVVNEAALSDGDLAGKMPRGSQFGFVFTKQATEAAIVRTVVHEIGHGDYTLEHTFSTNVGLDKGSTDNLMDYGSGYGLIKYQWDVLHDPGSVWGIFEDDAAGENYTVTDISRDLLNADGKTVAFLTPSGTILAVPFAGLKSVEFQYGAIKTIRGQVDQFDATITAGALRSFKSPNSEQVLTKYHYADGEGVYRDDAGNLFKQILDDTTKVDGFVYPIQCGDKYKLRKFIKINLPLHKGGEPKLTFLQMAERFNPFKDQIPLHNTSAGANTYYEQDIKNVVYQGCMYCITPITVRMTEDRCWEEGYLWIDKLAQMRNVYPDYFDHFTQPDVVKFGSAFLSNTVEKAGNWILPQTISTYVASGTPGIPGSTRTVNDYDCPWGKYLIDHPDVKAAYGKDNILFFKTFYTEFIKYINTAVVQDGEFWERFNDKTPVKDIYEQLLDDPIFHLQSIPVEKRGPALKMMTDGYNNEALTFFEGKDQSYIRLLSSFIGDPQAAAMLKYIEKNITIKKIHDLFNNGDKPELSQIGVMMALSNMITSSGYYNYSEDEIGEYLLKPETVAEVEADMLQFKNADVDFTDANKNKLFINNKLYDYNDYVSIKIVGTFEMGGKPVPKGQILQIPALQVALMSSVANMRQTEKQIMLTIDVGMMLIGMGEVKVFLEGGKYITKAIVVANIVGSAGGIAVQLINYDAMDPKWRTTLQIASLALSLPSMVKAAPKVSKYIDDLDLLIDARRGKAAATEIAELERIASGLCKKANVLDIIEDGKEIGKRAVAMDKVGDAAKAKNWLNIDPAVDNNFYIVVHGNGSEFSVIHQGAEIPMSHRSLAKWINNQKIDPRRQLVLLSCADIETAQSLARKVERSVVANHGTVKVYDNGVIEAENGFKYIEKNGDIDNSKVLVVGEQNPKSVAKEMVQLGKKAARATEGGVAKTLGISRETASKLLKNNDFVTAYEEGADIIKVIEQGLPNAAVTVRGTTYASHKAAIATAIANDPKFFQDIRNVVNRAEEIIKAGPKTPGYEALRDLRYEFGNILNGKGFEIDFFANGYFSTNVYKFADLDAEGLKLLKEAQEGVFSSIGKDAPTNIAAFKMETATGTEIHYAHSGKPALAGTIEDATRPHLLDQFYVSGTHRVQDSESKFFTWLYKNIIGKKINENTIKKITIYSKRPVCPSCANIIRMFREDFGIEIIVHEGKFADALKVP